MGNLEKTNTEFPISLTMEISGILHLKNVPKDVANVLKKKTRLPNQAYYQAVKRNPRARYTLSPYIPYYDEPRPGELILPRGLCESARQYFERSNIPYTYHDRRIRRPARIEDTITLRDYQRGVPEAITRSDHGVVRADTSFGKSIIAIRTASILQERTLIIVPKLDLLTQFAYEIKRYTGKDAGIIQAQNFDVKDITVATVQTIQKRVHSGVIKGDEFGCVIVDECHGAITQRNRKAIGHFRSRFLYGFTATARRTDGQGQAIMWMFGSKIIDKKMPSATPSVSIKPYKGKIWMQEYADIVKDQTRDEERNNLIINLAKSEIAKKRKILILTKRVAHYELLKQQLADTRVYAISSREKKAVRGELLKGFKDGTKDFDVLLGTFSLLSTGVDIPCLDTLIIAGDLKSDVLAEQAAGRILRLFHGKQDPLILDVWDTNNNILRNQGRLRQQFYKQKGWKIV